VGGAFVDWICALLKKQNKLKIGQLD